MNTHIFDGILKEQYLLYSDTYTKLVNETKLNQSPSWESSLIEMKLLIEHIDFKDLRENVLEMLALIERDVGTPNNYDPTNNIHLQELLPRVWGFIRAYDNSGKYVFFEQIADIKNGTCAQGRITRPLQFFMYEMERITNSLKQENCEK
jgi:hypothetical protein